MNGFTRAGCSLAWMLAAMPAIAQPAAGQSYRLPEQALGTTLREIARISGSGVIVDALLVEGLRAPPLVGRFEPADALDRVLVGTGLRAERVGDGFIIQAGPAQRQPRAEAGSDEETGIVVTGTRIRGAPVASSVIVRTADTIRNEGQASLPEVIRTIPQNFGGGQNPGVGPTVPAAAGINVGAGSSLNLRGLGSDATLTLLNGKRLAYSSSRQSIDVSAIPANAVDRIELVVDGASALYGSDAIAGVANIKLRRDADGITTSARVGSSTDGGNFEQLYGVLAGHRWNGGGALLAYEFGRNTAIVSDDRDYTRDVVEGLDLFPSLKRHSLVLSGHHELAPDLEIAFDFLSNRRESITRFSLSPRGSPSPLRAEQPSSSRTRTIAPSLKWSPGAWRFELAGSSGRDRVRYENNQFSGTQQVSGTTGCYCNDAQNIEFAADGPIFTLPGGPAKIALGTGYRNNRLVSLRGTNVEQNVDENQDSRYVYAEASLPLVGPRQLIVGIERLHVSAALRHEAYAGIEAVTTPKLGLIYAPAAGIEIKGSWGRSFRAPTLLQRYQPQTVAVLPASIFGGTGLPASATAVLLSGGRDTLLPERAESWSTTIGLSSAAVEGLRIELSYFETRYRDRIVSPITFIQQALSDPIYADQIIRSPSLALLETLRLGAAQFLNATGRPYDPGTVVAVVDNANLNAGSQRIRGVDALASFDRDLPEGRLNATLSLGYLESEQQLTPAQPVVMLAGAIFNPPHLRGRGTLGWTRDGLTVTGAVTHIGGVEDRRLATPVPIDGMTQADLTLRYRTGDGPSWWRGLDLVLSAQNLFNAKPDGVRVSLPSETPFDSTNYSALGRFISFSVAKTW